MDILCVSETWLLPHTPNIHYHVLGYSVVQCDKGRGGGTCVYIKDTLVTKVIDCGTEWPKGMEDI